MEEKEEESCSPCHEASDHCQSSVIYTPLPPESVTLPKHWIRCFDDNHQAFYYYHEVDGHSQWEFPLPPEGEEEEEGEDMILYEGQDEEEEEQDEPPLITRSPPSQPLYIYQNHHHHHYHHHTSLPGDPSESQLVEDEGEGSNSGSGSGRVVCDEVHDRVYAMGRRRNRDYLQLARAYHFQRPYSDPHYKAICLLCHQIEATDVFFPCQHRCVCRPCIDKESICEEQALRENPDGYAMCSLCAEVIKKILPFEGGKEEERYWDWVYEEAVQLPPSFLRNFKHSAAVIEEVYVNDAYKTKDKNSLAGSTSNTCSIS
eukprot:gene10701-11876_t